MAVVLASAAGVPARAGDIPAIHQVYQAADAGRLDDAQLVMGRVLRVHPNSAKAHYVEAELLARMDRPTQAEMELRKAEQLEAGLPFAKPQSVKELERQIARENTVISGGISPAAPGKAFSWGIWLLVLGLLAIVNAMVCEAQEQSARPKDD